MSLRKKCRKYKNLKTRKAALQYLKYLQAIISRCLCNNIFPNKLERADVAAIILKVRPTKKIKTLTG